MARLTAGSFIALTFVVCVTAAGTSCGFSPASSSAPTPTPNPTVTTPLKYLFVFGDSYSTTGFNWTAAQPSPKNPIGNPAFPGVNTCGKNDPNWVDYLLVKYNSTVTMGYDFAVSGATVDNALIKNTVSFADQVVQFTKGYTANGKPGGKLKSWTGANSAVAMWFGINDIGLTYMKSGDRLAFNDKILDKYFEQVRTLYTLGHRNFVFLNVPPVNRSPMMISEKVGDKVKPIILNYNSKLAKRVATFKTNHPNAKVTLIDTHTVMRNLLNSPKKHGFKDATTFSHTEKTVMWCNNYHISPGVHDFVARAVEPKLK
ncbi:hypothetical protein EXIGLDRAFT_832338 [Exidia glandulosa HHB12029]|uniref:Carbohydrate esterase family 16 protein n=1 Tax=Exidia glandulosa HHB12029 TaxID=1314781 RepID=A0A165LSA5_EXIGL|nr:hypothetical protein EXIGLDRAFT_832338 [Exidia glandulosa HHB12029]